jgi:hypothetical protein
MFRLWNLLEGVIVTVFDVLLSLVSGSKLSIIHKKRVLNSPGFNIFIFNNLFLLVYLLTHSRGSLTCYDPCVPHGLSLSLTMCI